MPKLTNDVIMELAGLLMPYLLFDPMEQQFPIVAEEWLNHRATERWDKKPTHQRGTNVMVVQQTASSYGVADVKAGSDDPAGNSIKLDGSAPDGIAQPLAFDPASQDMFLDCAGWDDTPNEVGPSDPTFTSGSQSYIQALFSSLGHAMNGAIPESTPNPAPKFDFSRINSPTIYAEVDWAGRYPRLDQIRADKTGSQPDFPSSISDPSQNSGGLLVALDNYIAVTYYLLYPLMQPSPVSQPDLDTWRNREGQWEAISIFLKGDPDFATTDPDGRPDFPVEIFQGGGNPLGGARRTIFRTPEPKFVVYSKGYVLGDDSSNPLSAEVRPWSDPKSRADMQVSMVDAHPIAYVTAGTHKNLFSIDAVVTPGTSQPDPALNTTGAAIMGVAGSVAGICAGISGLPPAAVVCIIIAAIVFLIGLILFLLSFLFPSTTPSTESPQSSQPGTDVARDGGPAAGPPPPPPAGGLPVNAPITVNTNLRFISMFRLDPAGTPPVSAYPLPEFNILEMPSWWSFPGRWGVRVLNRASGQWDSGTRRVDTWGRSRAYWNAYQVIQFLADPARAQDGITA